MNNFQKQSLTPFCFRRWTNKSYAIFNSLHRCVKISVLCAGYTMLVSPERCFAQTDSVELKTIDIEEVEVSADASPDVFAPIGRTITQVQRVEIERAAVQSLVEMLAFMPNVDLRTRGPLGAQADLSIRGSTFDQTLVLLNGINISDSQTGHYSLNLPIDIESVEKIEILEGPAARIFGNNALGGVVNFITGTQPENLLRASLARGEHGFYKASLAATAHTRRTTHHLAVSETASDGYMHNTDFQNLTVFMQNKWNDSIAPLDLQLGYSQRDYGAKSFYGARFPDQHELLHTFFAALSSNFSAGKVNISPAIYWRRNNDRYTLIRDNPDVYRNFHFTDAYGANVLASSANRFGRASAGLIVRNERIFSNNLGEQMEQKDYRKVRGHSDKWYDKTDRRTNTSVFLEQNLHLGKWSASIGALANHNNYTGKKINIYPGIDLAYRPNDIFRIYASANRAMRLPTFTDLYYEAPTHRSNPDLEPENSTEYELGTRITMGNRFFNVNYFYRTISDAIAWIWQPGDQISQSMNLTKIYTHGISIGGYWNIGENFPVQSVSAFYTFMDSYVSANYQSDYERSYLRHKLNIAVTHRIIEKVSANWQITRQDRNGGYLRYDTDTGIFDAETTPYDPFWKIDLRIYRQTQRLNVFVEASNLANKQHRDFGNIMLPKRWIRAGIALTLM